MASTTQYRGKSLDQIVKIGTEWFEKFAALRVAGSDSRECGTAYRQVSNAESALSRCTAPEFVAARDQLKANISAIANANDLRNLPPAPKPAKA